MGDHRSNPLSLHASKTNRTMEERDDELEHLAPTLYRLKGHDPFVVPADLFARFPHRVQSSILELSDRSTPWYMPRKRWAWAIPMALAAGLWWAAYRPGPSAETNGVARTEHVHNDLLLDGIHEDDLWAAYAQVDGNGTGPVLIDQEDEAILAYLEDAGALDLYMFTEEP